MSKNRNASSPWQLVAGIFFIYCGLALVGCGEVNLLQTRTPELYYVGGFLLCMFGILLIWKEPLEVLFIQNQETPEQSGGRTLLGRIKLNGYCFEAYEEETADNHRRFRLQSFPPTGPEREAGFIRYLIHEGFIEKRWPRLSKKIKEESSWAFLL